MIKVNIELTSSKIFAFFAFIVVSIYSFLHKDPMPMTTAIPSLAGLYGVKMYKDIRMNGINNSQKQNKEYQDYR